MRRWCLCDVGENQRCAGRKRQSQCRDTFLSHRELSHSPKRWVTLPFQRRLIPFCLDGVQL